ncbi:hypothetical protein ZIOFF_006149 [Zingiber officinale]|uniref:Uncharacterized protein n=1 Tax=Zingiber officinale TaxID=94328 RepID=A0A8J5IDU4_ZINOF|nr:hypothetical protein ZIOFF_006149 [Zingiber officinale]
MGKVLVAYCWVNWLTALDRGFTMDISWDDGIRLWSLMWKKEQMMAKKRRLLMGPVTSLDGHIKRCKKPQIATNLYLPEYYVRNDEVTADYVRTAIERSFSCDGKGNNQMIQDYLQLVHMHVEKNKCNNGLQVKQKQNAVRNKEKFVHETPTFQFCLKSINNMLEALDEMSHQDLTATNRKLRSVSLKLKFPLTRFTGSRELLIERLKKKFQKFISKLSDGDALPEPLFNALSVIYLSFMHRSRHIDMVKSKFYPFSPDVAALQSNIIKALGVLPKVKNDELKDIHALLDPEAKVPPRRFKCALRNYLIEYLFECNEIDITQELLNIIHLINQRMHSQTVTLSTKTIEEEVEVVMVSSCHLNQIMSSPLSDQSDDENLLHGFGNNESADAFSLAGTDYFLCLSENEDGEVYGCCSNFEAGATGQATPSTDLSFQKVVTEEINLNSKGSPAFEQDDVDEEKPCLEEAANFGLDRTTQNSKSLRLKSNQEVCDETSLVAYKLIGSILDNLLKTEGTVVDLSTRCYLNGGLSDPADLSDAEGVLNTSKINYERHMLVQTVEELVPSLSKSCIRRMKNFMEPKQEYIMKIFILAKQNTFTEISREIAENCMT